MALWITPEHLRIVVFSDKERGAGPCLRDEDLRAAEDGLPGHEQDVRSRVQADEVELRRKRRNSQVAVVADAARG
ncbi:MAG: hypothetical protein EXR79_13095 [Myxococcales bacterium]|nr:hypothetical protein [Myxococcales bacterium]